MLPINESLTERVHMHQAWRQEILIEMARLRGQKEMSLSKLGKKQITAFCKALKEKFQDKASNFGKEYLKLLVDEIKVAKEEVHLTGSFAALAGALCNGSERGSLAVVPVPYYIGSPGRKWALGRIYISTVILLGIRTDTSPSR